MQWQQANSTAQAVCLADLRDEATARLRAVLQRAKAVVGRQLARRGCGDALRHIYGCQLSHGAALALLRRGHMLVSCIKSGVHAWPGIGAVRTSGTRVCHHDCVGMRCNMLKPEALALLSCHKQGGTGNLCIASVATRARLQPLAREVVAVGDEEVAAVHAYRAAYAQVGRAVAGCALGRASRGLVLLQAQCCLPVGWNGATLRLSAFADRRPAAQQPLGPLCKDVAVEHMPSYVAGADEPASAVQTHSRHIRMPPVVGSMQGGCWQCPARAGSQRRAPRRGRGPAWAAGRGAGRRGRGRGRSWRRASPGSLCRRQGSSAGGMPAGRRTARSDRPRRSRSAAPAAHAFRMDDRVTEVCGFDRTRSLHGCHVLF